MTPRPLSLSSEQLRIVREHAKALPVEWRDRYLSLIADYLTNQDVTDETVSTAVQSVLPQMLSCSRCCSE